MCAAPDNAIALTMPNTESQQAPQGRLRLSMVNVTSEPSALKARSAIKSEIEAIAAGYGEHDLGVIRVFATIRQVSQIGTGRLDKLLKTLVDAIPALQTIQLIREPGPLSAEQMMARAQEGERDMTAVMERAGREEAEDASPV